MSIQRATELKIKEYWGVNKNVENSKNGTAWSTTVSWGQATDGTTN